MREKVIAAWAIALSQNGYSKIEEVPGLPSMDFACNQPKHYNIVTRLAKSLLEIYNDELDGVLKVDPEILIASALLHDVGNPYEYSKSKREKWEADPSASGLPLMRHTFYGAHLALELGLPEEIAHVCACHAGEGQLIKRSLTCTILYVVDDLFWKVLKSAYNVYQ